MVRKNPLSFMLGMAGIYLTNQNHEVIALKPILPRKSTIVKIEYKNTLNEYSLVVVEEKKDVSTKKTYSSKNKFSDELDLFVDLLSQDLRKNNKLTNRDRQIIKNTQPEVILALLELMLYKIKNTQLINRSIFIIKNSPKIKIRNILSMYSKFSKILGVKHFHRSDLLTMDLLCVLSKSILFYPFIAMLDLSHNELQKIAGDDSTEVILECLQKTINSRYTVVKKGECIKNTILTKGIDNKKLLQKAIKEICEKNK